MSNLLRLAFVYHQMDIPIHVQDGDSTLVRFEGCGFRSPALGSTNPFNCSDTKASEQSVQRRPFPGQVRAVVAFYSAEYQQSTPFVFI